LLPTPERRRHDPIGPAPHPIQDSHGAIARPLKVVDMLARMELAGEIGPGERRAGEKFHDLYRVAHLDPLHASDPTRVPVMLAKGNVRLTEGNEDARLRVLRAIDALGGLGSPGGSCACHVLGEEMSLTQWAQTVGWNGPYRMSRIKAPGCLITVLGILAKHFGY